MIFPHTATRTGFLLVAIGFALTAACSMEALPGTIGEPTALRVDASDSGGDRQSGETDDDGGRAAPEPGRPDGSRFVAARPPEIGSRPAPIPIVPGDASALPPRPVYAPMGPIIVP